MNIPLFFQREAGKCFKKEGILKKKKIHQKYPYFFRFGRYLKFGPLIYIIFLLLFFLQDSKIPWLRHSVPPAQDLPSFLPRKLHSVFGPQQAGKYFEIWGFILNSMTLVGLTLPSQYPPAGQHFSPPRIFAPSPVYKDP